jgi:hypothetical protein
MRRRLAVLALLALLMAPAAAHAEAAAVPSWWTAAGPVGQRFIAVAAGAAVGAMMPQLAVADGLVLMSAVMGGMTGDMMYSSAHGAMPK